MKKIDDNTLHVWAGMIISFFIAFFLVKLHVGFGLASILGLIFGVLVGLGKEFIWDRKLGRGVFNPNDYYATGWGSLVGAFIYFVGYLIVHNN